MAKTSAIHKSQVILTAFDRNDAVVEQQSLSYEEYYEQLPPLVDSNEYRASKAITRVTGKVYNSQGGLDQDFENRYSDKGEYVRSRVVHADGTVTEE